MTQPTDIGRALEILMRDNRLDVGRAAQRLQELAEEHGARLEDEASRIVDAHEDRDVTGGADGP